MRFAKGVILLQNAPCQHAPAFGFRFSARFGPAALASQHFSFIVLEAQSLSTSYRDQSLRELV
jgi:hypothetical protein